jgi:hypothetical protein
VSDYDRLAELFRDEFYTHPQGGGAALKARIDSGEVKFKFAPKNWREDWYSDPYFKVSVPVALSIASALAGPLNFEIYYTPDFDFHHVRFEYDGDTYAVQWYKVFVLYRKSDGKQCSFAYDRYSIAPFFRRGDHKNDKFWFDGGRFATPFKEQES